MSNKTQRLQREAARMIVYGAHDWDIMDNLKILHNRLERLLAHAAFYRGD